jgi:hypothetical protein
MQFLPTPVHTLYQLWNTLTACQNPDAIEINLTFALAGSKEREERRKKGLCFKCRKHGYISWECSVPILQAWSNSVPYPACSTSSLT